MASTSCNVIAKYDLDSYDTRYVVAAFMELERKVKERYKLLKVHLACFSTLILPVNKPYFQSAGEWANAEGILREAVAKDKRRILMMNERINKVSG